MGRYQEAPELNYKFKIYPYKNLNDALNSLYRAQESFDDRFKVRAIGEGFILTSETHILDARGYCADKLSPLDGDLESIGRVFGDSRVITIDEIVGKKE